MKNSASSSCGSVKIFFCTALIEANFSPLYSIIRSARLCLLSLLGAAGAAFSILRAAALSPSEPFTHMLTRAPSSACGGHRPGAGGPRRTERHRGGRRSVTTSASAGQYDSGMLFTAASRAPLRRVLRPQRCRARPYTARVALHVLTRGCRCTFIHCKRTTGGVLGDVLTRQVSRLAAARAARCRPRAGAAAAHSATACPALTRSRTTASCSPLKAASWATPAARSRRSC